MLDGVSTVSCFAQVDGYTFGGVEREIEAEGLRESERTREGKKREERERGLR